MRKPPNIALLGAGDPSGEAVLRLIEERECEVGDVYPLDFAESDRCVSLRGEESPLLDAAEFDWSRADILLAASRSPAARRFELAAVRAGCAVIGLGGGSDLDADKHIRVPGAVAQAVQRVLSPLARQVGLAEVDVFAALPVSQAGQTGIDELVGQTRSLFAMESPEAETFPLQMAFNLIPQVGAILDNGASAYESMAQAEIRRLMKIPDLPVSVTATWVPVFYGGALAVHGRANEDMDDTRLREWLAAWDGVTLMDTRMPGGVPSPATDAQDSENVFVGRARVMDAQPRRFAMWLVMDMARLEAARIMDELEILIEK